MSECIETESSANDVRTSQATAHGALMTGQREAQHVLDVIEAESLEA